MFGWIASVFSFFLPRLPSWLRSFVRSVWDVTRSLWNGVETAISYARQGITAVWNGVNVVTRALNSWSTWVSNRISDLYNRYVPRVVRNAIDGLRNLLSSAIFAARRLAEHLFTTAIDWARRAINGVYAFVRQWIDWVVAGISEIRKFVNGVVRNIQHILGGPRRLAEWLIGAMVDALWLYILKNETRIFRWVQRRSLSFALWGAGRVESLIRRLL